MIIINIAKDFSDTPGGRFIKEGPYSGELFRNNYLLPKYKEAKEKSQKLIIDMDGCYGYASSFLDEAFGVLSEELKDKKIMDNIKIISNDEPGLKKRIEKLIERHYL